MRRLQILRGQIQYKPELKDGEFFLDKTNHSLLIGDTSVADGQFELAKQSAITNLQQQVDTKITAAQAPVQSVNTKTGAVVLTAADVGAVPTTRTVNGKALSADITLTASDVGALPSTTKIPTYTLTKDETSADYAAVYHLTKDGTNVGVPINIPKDLFVESGEIVDNPTGQPEGKYIKLVLQNQTDPIYINVADLVDAYTAGNGITISNTNVVSANVSAGNGLSVDADGIKMAVASTDSAGAMSSADFTKLSGIETGAQKNTVTSVNGSTGAVTIIVPTKVTDLTDAADYATVTSVNAVADDVDMLNDEVGTLTTDVDTLKTNITSKQNTITGGASTITDNNLTAYKVLISDGNGKVDTSDISSNSLGYLDGVTSKIQPQINNLNTQVESLEDSVLLKTSEGSAITLPSSHEASHVVYGNGKFVIVNDSTQSLYSTDGISWIETTISKGFYSDWSSIVYGNETFVAVRNDPNNTSSAVGAIYSIDGITWSDSNLPGGTWQSVTYGNNKFVAVRKTGAAYSTDGITWTTVDIPKPSSASNNYYWTSVAYGDGKFVAVGKDAYKSAYSEDGITWNSSYYTISSTYTNCVSIAYGNGKFVVVTNDATTLHVFYQEGFDSYSSWNLGSVNTIYGLIPQSVTYNEGKFIIVGTDYKSYAKIGYSEDGNVWTFASFAENNYPELNSVAYGNRKYIAVAANNSNKVLNSVDGTNWSNNAITGFALNSTSGTDITSSVYSALEPYIPAPTVPTKTSELTNDSGYITQSDGDGRYLKLSGGALNGNTKVLNGKNITFYADETGEEIYVSMYMDGNYDFVISSAATAGNSIGRLKMYNVMTPTNSYMAANKYYVDQYAPHAKLITLTVAGWDSTAKTQTVTVSGILADESKQLIIPMPAVASMTAYNDAGIQCTGQAANSLTFTATTVPTAAISVYVTYQAVIS